MSKLLNTFEKFLEDNDSGEMYITGVAGTGKTTSLGELLEYCIEHKIPSLTTAYTHKACGILRNKLPKKAAIATLHSYLKKCPTINSNATKLKHVDGNAQVSIPDKVRVLFIDEFSMVGERDFVDIADLQYDEEGNLVTKVVYIGDPNQLPPVKDTKAIEPSGKYWFKLTKIHRQAKDNPLIDTLMTINDFINGAEPTPLLENESFIRGVNIVQLYKECKTSKVLLAYTNATVQDLNGLIQGRYVPEVDDTLFSPTNRKMYKLIDVASEVPSIMKINEQMLELGTKYKTLETIHEIEGVSFYYLEDEQSKESPIAAVFGHQNYLDLQQELANKAVFFNKKILKDFQQDPKEWSRINWSHKLAKERGKAWSKYLAFKDCVHCLDFNHAMTVHKSQGSTYENVFLDIEDMNLCAKKDYSLYLKLLYVGISRASDKVFTN